MYDLALVAAVTYLGPALVRRVRTRWAKAAPKAEPQSLPAPANSSPPSFKCLAFGHRSAGRVPGTPQEQRREGSRDFLIEEHACVLCRVRFEVHIPLPSEDEIKAAKRILAQREFAVAQIADKSEESSMPAVIVVEPRT